MNMTFIILIMIAIFLGALVRSYFGFGESLISMPILALIGLDLNTAISVIGLAGLLVAILNIVKSFENIKYRVLSIMIIGSLFGIPVGIYILHNFSTEHVQTIIAIGLILYGFLSFFKRLVMRKNKKLKLYSSFWSIIAGFLSGILGIVYNTHGTPIVIYATMSKYKLTDFKNTIQAHFIITSIFVVIGQASGNIWTKDTLPLFLMSIPVLIVATFIGKWLGKKTSNSQFEIWVFFMIGMLGLLMLFS